MSAPLRFLALVVIGWGTVRATTAGVLPGFTVSYARPAPASPAPVVPTELSPMAMPGGEGMDPPWAAATPVQPAYVAVRIPVPYYLPAYPAAASSYPPRIQAQPTLDVGPAWTLPLPGPSSDLFSLGDYASLPPLAATAIGGQLGSPAPPSGGGAQQPPKLDRWAMSTWAFLRGAPTPGALATGGTLGGSQAGARVTYALNRSVALSLRTTSPVGGSRGAEVAAGVRWAPLRSLPIAITAERRQSISPHGGGRNDFALFVEGGVYQRPMPLRFQLDGYAQAGVVGVTERDLFADGALAFTRPVYRNFSAGFGLWGGYQMGIYRIDAGPRISIPVRANIRAHIDYRQRLAGSALPSSGPTLTLAADF